MQDQIGFGDLFQGRPEGCNQVCGQLLDKTNRVSEQDFSAPWHSDAPRGRVQGGE